MQKCGTQTALLWGARVDARAESHYNRIYSCTVRCDRKGELIDATEKPQLFETAGLYPRGDRGPAGLGRRPQGEKEGRRAPRRAARQEYRADL